MVKEVSKKAQQIERSLAYEIRDMVSGYKDSISLSVGEPDFPTPAHIAKIGKEAIDQGVTHYAGDEGMRALRKAIAEQIKVEKGLDIDPVKGVVITIGAAAANFATIMSLVDPGDEVILPNIHYPPYQTDTILAGGVPRYMKLREDKGFNPVSEDIEQLITDKTKLIIINSPSNPTGGVVDEDCLQSIADIAKKHDLFVLSDEVYEKFVYDDNIVKSIAMFPGMSERTIITNSLSKTYAMTGWRVGYAAGDAKLISQLVKIHYAVNVSAPSMAQKAAIAALTGPQDCVKRMIDEYDRRRKIIFEGINKIKGIRCLRPQGAFYVFPNISALGMSSVDLAKRLAMEAKVATVPGTTYGPDGEGYLRLSYASSTENIVEALQRIKKVVEKL
ncbi:MAG: pyridoxal phosphate-dependent aminotransferase [Candidatus Bathyarchaeota archaeon]